MPEHAYSDRPLPPRLPLVWVGSSREDLKACPNPVQSVMGKALLQVQLGQVPRIGKRLKGHLGGLVELVDSFDGDTFQAVYTAKLAGAVYVLHVFPKKSTHGIATPRHVIALILQRLRGAQAHHAEHFGRES
ncbi:MAG: type II toxin-antitoxin system RelE/ParE family toxin [Gemmatimonadetes bacterium]|nr:type II toxin-antitoxin system RelE/ParE family toxin [Gemmatimonadota bacterium]